MSKPGNGFLARSLVGMSTKHRKRAMAKAIGFDYPQHRGRSTFSWYTQEHKTGEWAKYRIGERLRICPQCNGRVRPPGQAGFAYEDCDLCHGRCILPSGTSSQRKAARLRRESGRKGRR